MGAMAREFFGASPLLGLPILALLIFAGVFLMLTVRTIRLGKTRATALASLALDPPMGPDADTMGATHNQQESHHG